MEKEWKIKQKQLYDLWANVSGPEPLSKFWELYGNFDDFVDDFPKETCGWVTLDIGCGEGRFTRLMASKGAYAIGVEISKGCLKLAHKRTERTLRERLDFVLADAEHLPFRADSFNVVTILFVLHHLPSFSILPEVFKVLKGEGQLFLAELVQNNPILALGRKTWPLIFSSIRSRACQAIDSRADFAPERNLFTIGELHRILVTAGFCIGKETKRHVFLFPLEYLIRLIPSLNFFFLLIKLFFVFFC
jgi:SAM-dependent methyltransferase